jgi:hypothetical protein
MSRKVQIGMDRFTDVLATDVPGQGNACHEYVVTGKDATGPYAVINFQNGAILESGGVNGCHNEDLIAIVIDRLQGFQSSEFSCRENALAITKLEEALHWLHHRTNARIARGVEGTHKI